MLSKLRSDLFGNYQDFFSLLAKRKDLVEQIFALKSSTESYLPEVELKLFSQELFSQKNLLELLAISFIIEEQANIYGSYPKWSQREHLENGNGELFEQLNPLLLLKTDPNAFKNLQFKTKYQFLRNYQ